MESRVKLIGCLGRIAKTVSYGNENQRKPPEAGSTYPQIFRACFTIIIAAVY